MTLQLSKVYRNRTAGQNTDRSGKMSIEFVAALCDAHTGYPIPYWRRKHQGDGLAMYSSGTVNAFSYNGGLGYRTDGGSMAATNAASFSNVNAYIVLAELDAQGLPTGRELKLKRHSSGVSTVSNNMSVWFSYEPFTGTANATTDPATSATDIQLQIAGSGGSLLTGLTLTDYEITDPNTLVYHVWEPATPGGASGDVATFGLACHDRNVVASDGTVDFNLFGGVFLYAALKEGATTDPHPCVVSCSSWLNVLGEQATSAPSIFQPTASLLHTTNDAGALSACAFAKMGVPSNFNEPEGTSATDPRRFDGALPLYPMLCHLDPGAGVEYTFKGVAEDLLWCMPPTADFLFPTTLFADVEGAESPRILMGVVSLPWEVGLDALTNALAPTADRTDAFTIFRGGPTDSVPPLIGAPTPAPGAISNTQALTVDVTDPGGAVKHVVVTIDYSTPNRHEIAFNGLDEAEDYDLDYNAASTVTPIADGYRYSVAPDVAWRGPFMLTVTAVDSGGNVTSATHAYTLLTAVEPAVSFSPAPGSVNEGEQIQVDVSDPSPLAGLFVSVAYESGGQLVIWDGAELVAPFTALSSEGPIAGGVRITIVPDEGWSSDFTLHVRAIDVDGHVATEAASYELAVTAGASEPIAVGERGANEYVVRNDVVERALGRLLEQFR